MLQDSSDGQQTSTAAILALFVAVVGVIMVFTGKPGWGMLLEVIAATLGAIGFFMAASPRISGGALSVFAILLAVVGIGLSVLGVIGSAIF